MKRADPTTTTGWEGTEQVPDWVVEEPVARAGSRGMEPFEITPGAPPVRAARAGQPSSARRRTLLRDATIQRRLLRKANATPNLAPPRKVVGEGRSAPVGRKPDTVPTDFFKPANPLITNVVSDRLPEARKADDPTLDPAPVRQAAAPVTAVAAVPPVVADDLGDDWFDMDGTVEPADEREGEPAARLLVVGFGVGAVVVTALAVIVVALMSGPQLPDLPEPVEPGWEPIITAAPPALPPAVTEPVAAPEAVAPVPVAPEVTPAAGEPVRVDASVPEAPVVPDLPQTTSLDRLRQGVADNPMFEAVAPEVAAEPVSAPVDAPAGTAELWGGIAPDEQPQDIWGALKNSQ